MRGQKLGLTLVLLGLGACDNEKVAHCEQQFQAAQAKVNKIDSRSIDSVGECVSALEAALGACREAQRSSEVDELNKAYNQISAHKKWLESRPEKRKKRTAADLERLVKQGDPDCPKGMGYKDKDSGKEIRCIGPAPLGMTFAQAKEYFERRDFKLSEPTKTSLKAEYGAELFEIDYANGTDKPPSCFKIYPPPGMGWQEATARASGARIQKIEVDKPLTALGKTWPMKVLDSKRKVVVSLGVCSG